jgi:hypothetical protein
LLQLRYRSNFFKLLDLLHPYKVPRPLLLQDNFTTRNSKWQFAILLLKASQIMFLGQSWGKVIATGTPRL